MNAEPENIPAGGASGGHFRPFGPSLGGDAPGAATRLRPAGATSVRGAEVGLKVSAAEPSELLSSPAVDHRQSAQAVRSIPRLALTIEEACEALGVSPGFWREHVADEVPLVRRGRRKLVAVSALQAWLDRNAETTLGTGIGTPSERKSPANTRVRASRAPVR